MEFKTNVSGRLEGKVALITGAARGLGEADARLFAKAGASLILTDILEDELFALAKELQQEGVKVVAAKHDVSKTEDWKTVLDAASKEFDKIDVLVNNAGIGDPGGVESTTEDMWDKMVGINQKGVWMGMKMTIPYMRKAKGGTIVNISSVAGLIGAPNMLTYNATKGAVRLMTKSAAKEYARENIRVNSVHPGIVDTPIVSGLGEELAKKFTELTVGLTPLRKMGDPIDVAYAVLFLACAESAHITGAELVIDGGFTA